MKSIKRGKMIFVPYPAQGHVTPMIKLASTFVSHGFEAVMVTPEFIHPRISTKTVDPHISYMSIPDGLEKDGTLPPDFFAIEIAMENNMPLHFQRLLHKLADEKEGGGVECVVVDLLASWAITVAHQCEIHVAGFWPAMLTTYQLISAIPHMVRKGIISETTGIPQYQGPICFGSSQPMLSTDDLPWLIGTLAARKSRFKFWNKTLDRSTTLQWILVNTFPEEYCHKKQSSVDGSGSGSQDYCPLVLPVGPLRIKHATSSFWEEDVSCLDWLDKQSSESVVYVSFGSWVNPNAIGDEKVKGLAMALEASGRPFLWVLGPIWREGLVVGKKGKVVSWAPQMEVLQHEAVGCYLTHCGWNSTLEAIQCKKPLLCYPVAGDQFVNCAYIVKVWRIGIEISGFGSKDVEQGIKRVMEDGQMNQRLVKLRERIMGEEASLTVMTNLTSFINDLLLLKK